MISRTAVALAALVPAAVVLAGPAPSATAADCTPSIAMDQPYQTSGGMLYFPATYTICETSKVTVKVRDRNTTPPDGWAKGSSVTPGPETSSTWFGLCPVGDVGRWVAYATIKTPTGGTVIAQSQKVYFRTDPLAKNCTDG